MVQDTTDTRGASPAVSTNILAPNFGATPREEQKTEWREAARDGVATVMVNRDKVLVRTTAMATVDYVMNGGPKSDGYFDTKLDELRLKTAGEKPTMRAATVATQLDRGRKETGAEARKLLDQLASAMEGLTILAGSDFEWSYSPTCVASLIGLVDGIGGLRKLADLARNENIDDNPRGVIRMDGKQVQEIIATQVRQRLSRTSASVFSLAVPGATGLEAVEGLELTLDDVTRALSNRDIQEGRVQALFELTRGTVAISREKTAFVKVHDDDPKDSKSPKRLTEPHIIIEPDGKVIVSAHLAAGSSNVVTMTGVRGLLDNPLDFHVMLPPQVHNKLALNLEKAAQRNAVEITVEAPDPDTTFAACTWHVRSDAAINTRYQSEGPGLRFSARFPTYGRKGERLDTVAVIRPDCTWSDVSTINCDFVADGFMNGIVAAEERIKRAATGMKAVRLSIFDKRFLVEAGKENQLSCAASGKLDPLHVTAADLRGLLLLLAGIRPREVKLAVDAGKAALRWSFSSHRARYELFMPAATATGTRLTFAFEPITIIAPSDKAA